MAGKSDARVRYTQHALKQALLTLLKEKSVNKITVKEVCELAELNRATFYSHYSDCFALLEAIENELLEAFAQSLTLIKSFDVAALIEAIYDMIGKNEEACRVLIFQNPGSTVIHRMIDYPAAEHRLLAAGAARERRGTGDAVHASVQWADACRGGGLRPV